MRFENQAYLLKQMEEKDSRKNEARSVGSYSFPLDARLCVVAPKHQKQNNVPGQVSPTDSSTDPGARCRGRLGSITST